MAKKNEGLSAELRRLHKKLKQSIKETAVHIQSQKTKYARELAQYETECKEYQDRM